MNYFSVFVKKTIRYLLKPLSFVPAILVMVMIFRFSAQTAVVSSDLSQTLTEKIVHSINYRLGMDWTPAEQALRVMTFEYYVRKLAHFGEFLLLAVTLVIPLYVHGVRKARLFFLTMLICALYALSDEYHQSFIEGRSPQILDTAVDCCGSLVGTLLGWAACHIGKKTIFKPLSLEKERQIIKRYEEKQKERRKRQKECKKNRSRRNRRP